jgi:hypothetical protein
VILARSVPGDTVLISVRTITSFGASSLASTSTSSAQFTRGKMIFFSFIEASFDFIDFILLH